MPEDPRQILRDCRSICYRIEEADNGTHRIPAG